jgi:hypothetical protein
MSHYQRGNAAAGGTIVAMHIAAADAAGGDADEDVGWSDGWPLGVSEIKLPIFSK